MICVTDVEASSRWYQSVLGFTSGHGGKEYEQLMSEGRMVMQLHAWDAHEHPHLGDPAVASRGNGVMLWFHDPQIDDAFARAQHAKANLLNPLAINPKAQHREFWLRDPDGYIVVVSGRYGDLGH